MTDHTDINQLAQKSLEKSAEAEAEKWVEARFESTASRINGR